MTVAVAKRQKSKLEPSVASDPAVEPSPAGTFIADDVFQDEDQEKTCRHMVSQLSESELEHAARTSYRYYVASIAAERDPVTQIKPSDEERCHLAMRMARRHLVAENGDADLALEKMKNTIQYRQDSKIDEMRVAFSEKDDESPEDGERTKTLKNIRDNIEHQLSTGKMYVRGYDTRDTATFVGVARRNNSDDPEWYIKVNMYTMERAIAATERMTNGKEEKVCALFDYNGYTSAHAPPISVTRDLFYCLKDHYPERLQHVFVIDAPLVFRGFWYLVKPFLDPITKKKVKFATGKDQKEQMFGPLFDKNQAMDFMFPDAKKTKPFNRDEYLYQIPFTHAFEED
jgi:hypothetical protein